MLRDGEGTSEVFLHWPVETCGERLAWASGAFCAVRVRTGIARTNTCIRVNMSGKLGRVGSLAFRGWPGCRAAQTRAYRSQYGVCAGRDRRRMRSGLPRAHCNGVIHDGAHSALRFGISVLIAERTQYLIDVRVVSLRHF